jgi:hypothetical protein
MSARSAAGRKLIFASENAGLYGTRPTTRNHMIATVSVPVPRRTMVMMLIAILSHVASRGRA